MKKIVGVIGNYGHNNLGDEAILYGLIDLLENDIDKVVFTESIAKSQLETYTYNLAEYKVLRRPFLGKLSNIPKIIVDIFKGIKSVDVVVFGGGGLLNDSYKFVALYYCFLGIVTRLLGKRYIVLGISVGPLRTRQAKFFSKIFLKLAQLVVVRDQPSYEFAQVVTKKAHKVPDLALAHKLRSKADTRNYIAVNLIPYKNPKVWFEKDTVGYNEYLNKSIEIITHLVINLKEDVVLFAIDFEFDSIAISDVYNKLPSNVQERVDIKVVKDVPSLTRLIQNAKLMYGSRLHAAVLATLCKTPFFSSAYQEKVSNFAAEVGNENNVQMLEDLDVKFVTAKLDSLIYDIEIHSNIATEREHGTANQMDDIRQILQREVSIDEKN